MAHRRRHQQPFSRSRKKLIAEANILFAQAKHYVAEASVYATPHGFWIRFIPTFVHPELRGWFRDRYEAAVASLPAYQRERHGEYRHWKWQALFDSTPPDRWSEEDTL